MDSGNCVCELGWVGVGCDSECLEYGMIVSDKCQCDVGWCGMFCENFGCLGDGQDCFGNGECNSVFYMCICQNGWIGDGCYIFDCFGNLDCVNRGKNIYDSENLVYSFVSLFIYYKQLFVLYFNNLFNKKFRW